MILLFITLALPFMLSAADTQNPSHAITVTTQNASGKIPLHVARLSFFMRSYLQQPIFAQTNIISLDFPNPPLRDAFELELLVPFLIKAEETLRANPVSSQGSYVQLVGEQPLALVDNPEKLVKLFIACNFLQFDFNQSQDFDHDAIIKAIALKMTCFSFDYKELFATFDDIAAQHSYNFQDVMWPYILTHCRLKNYYSRPKLFTSFTTIFRDILAHDKLKHWLTTTELKLHSINLTSLHGIEDIDLTRIQKLFLAKNKLTHIPNLDCPQLEYLDLWHNQLTAVPQCYLPKLRELDLDKNNIAVLPDNLNNFPNLKYLDLCNNPITKIPETLKRPGLTIMYGKY